MNEPIKAGDLAYLSQDHDCGSGEGAAGIVVQVDRVFTPVPVHCCNCNRPVMVQASFKLSDGDTYSVPLSWLRRIPPLSALDDVKHEEELTA